MSFIRYTALASRQNAPAAIALSRTAAADAKVAEEISGTKTRPFLIHCFGRQAITSACTPVTPSLPTCPENRVSHSPPHPVASTSLLIETVPRKRPRYRNPTRSATEYQMEFRMLNPHQDLRRW